MLYAQRVLPQTQLTPDGGKHTVAAGLVALYKNLGWGLAGPTGNASFLNTFPLEWIMHRDSPMWTPEDAIRRQVVGHEL